MAKKNTQKNKGKQRRRQDRARTRKERRKQFEQLRAAEDEMRNAGWGDPSRKRRFEGKCGTIVESSCDLTVALAEMLSQPYDVWASVYMTKSGVCVPYMLFAGDKVKNRESFMNRHRNELYGLIEDTHSAYDLPEGICVIAMAYPSGSYAAVHANPEVYIAVGRAAGIGESAEVNVLVSALEGVDVLVNVA